MSRGGSIIGMSDPRVMPNSIKNPFGTVYRDSLTFHKMFLSRSQTWAVRKHLEVRVQTTHEYYPIDVNLSPIRPIWSPTSVLNKKSPGYDLIAAKVARNLPKKVHLTRICNSMLRISYFPLLWTFSMIIMIQKPNKPGGYGKSGNSTSSYRPTNHLSFFAKILERLVLKRILPLNTEKHIFPDYQFDFHTSHSATHQLHRVVNAIFYSLQKKLYCTCAFLIFLKLSIETGIKASHIN